MAIQILPPEQTALGNLLGSLGTGLGAGIQQLGQFKLANLLQQQQYARDLQKLNLQEQLKRTSEFQKQLAKSKFSPSIGKALLSAIGKNPEDNPQELWNMLQNIGIPEEQQLIPQISSVQSPEANTLMASVNDQESTLGWLLRNLGRGAYKGATSLAGLPGDLTKAGYELGQLPAKALGLPTTSDILSKGYEFGKSGIEKLTGKQLPTAEQIGQAIQTLTPTSENLENLSKSTWGKALPKGVLEAQSNPEKVFDDIISTATTLALPSGGAISIPKALSMAGMQQLGKWSAKKIGFGPLGQESVGLGLMMLTGTAGGRALAKNKATNALEAALKEGESIQLKISPKALSSLESGAEELSRYASHPRAKKFANQLMQNINLKEINGKEAAISLEALNEIKPLLQESKIAQRALPKIEHALEDIFNANKLKYSSFVNNMQLNKELSSALNANAFYDKTIGKLAPTAHRYLKSRIARSVAGLAMGSAAITKIPASVGIVGGVAGANKISQILTAIYKSPTMRNIYFDLLKAGAIGKANEVTKALKRLDKEALKLEKQ